MGKSGFIFFILLFISCKKQVIKEGEYHAVFSGNYMDNDAKVGVHNDEVDLSISNITDSSFEVVVEKQPNLVLTSTLIVDLNDNVTGKIYTNQAYYVSPTINGKIDKKWGKYHITGNYEATGDLYGPTPILGTFTIEPK